MTREIKTRCWDTINKRYLPIDEYSGCFIMNGEHYAIPANRRATSGVTLVSPCQRDKGNDYFGRMSTTFFGNDLILEDYTGREDKDGKEIYESDILLWVMSEHTMWIVVWNEEKAAFGLAYMNGALLTERGHISGHNSIIIGNFHENPELLGENNES